jgi:hypothetical protein
MKRIYAYLKYIFFRAYVWQGKIQTSENRRVLTALAYVSILLGFYLLVLMAAVSDLFNVSVFSKDKGVGIIFAASFGLIFYIFPYLILIRGGYYKTIIAEME